MTDDEQARIDAEEQYILVRFVAIEQIEGPLDCPIKQEILDLGLHVEVPDWVGYGYFVWKSGKRERKKRKRVLVLPAQRQLPAAT